MSEYFIQSDTMNVLSNHAKRIAQTENEMNAAEILEVMSRTQGTLKTDGKYEIKAVDYNWNVLKSGKYDTGEVFALQSLVTNIDDAYFQGWASTSKLNKGYMVVDNTPVVIGAIYAPIDDVFTVRVNITEENFEFDIRIGNPYLTIDWGDGVVETLSSYPSGNIIHVYNNIGVYNIKCFGEVKPTYGVVENTYNYNLNYGESHGSNFIEEVKIPTYITEIPRGYFSALTSLKKVMLHNNIKSINERVFYNCSSIENIAIPNSVINLGDSAFEYCKNLKNIILPYKITSISDDAFYHCYSLQRIDIPDSVTSIGARAFYVQNGKSTRLPILRLPNVTFIGAQAFGNRGFDNIILAANEICASGGNVFDEDNHHGASNYAPFDNIYVPDSLVDGYKTDEYWSPWSAKIKPLSQYAGE